MNNPFILFWSLLILGSIAWYGSLVFTIGIKAGRDIRTMIQSLKTANTPKANTATESPDSPPGH